MAFYVSMYLIYFFENNFVLYILLTVFGLLPIGTGHYSKFYTLDSITHSCNKFVDKKDLHRITKGYKVLQWLQRRITKG